MSLIIIVGGDGVVAAMAQSEPFGWANETRRGRADENAED